MGTSPSGSSRRIANVNGRICAPEEARVSVYDRGFLFGDGVYETGRTFDRCPLFLEEHLSRLRSGAARLRIPVPWSDDELAARLRDTARAFAANSDVSFRLIVTRGEATKVGLDVTGDVTPTLVILMQDLPATLDDARSKGVGLLTSTIVRNSVSAQDPNIKTSNYLNSLLALLDVRERGAEDAILCDARGIVAEGTTFSVFGVTTEGKLITPALDVGILDSITRRHILTIARRHMSVQEGVFTTTDFLTGSEALIASSVRELVPVRSWDGRDFPCPGPVMQHLHREFRVEIARHVAAQKKIW